jgi:hypothetical protein
MKPEKLAICRDHEAWSLEYKKDRVSLERRIRTAKAMAKAAFDDWKSLTLGKSRQIFR